MAGAIDNSTRISPLQYTQQYTQNEPEKNSTNRNVQNISSFNDVALLMGKQSLRTDESYAAAVLKGKMSASEGESAAKLVTLSVSDARDTNKAERLAGAAASVLPAQNNITQPNNKPAETKNTTELTGATSATSASQARSHQAVEGGTDITAPAFINVVGSMSQLQVSNAIITVSNEAQRLANKSSAEASIRGVDAAGRAGNKMIKAARDNMNGAITSGTAGIAGQAATAGRTIGALNQEAKSITGNLKVARNLETGVRNHQNALLHSQDTMVHKGQTLSPNVQATASQSHTADLHTAALKRDAHELVVRNTHKVRVGSEFANQAIHSGQRAIEGGFGVAGSAKQKEAELARADREVNNELANVHSQVAKKTAEANAAAINALENALNINNNTISSMAERT